MRQFLAVAIFVLGGCASVPYAPPPDAEPAPIEVMVLGSWHFAGSGSDLISETADSVLSARRQEELDALVSALARFRPTVVATERVATAPGYLDEKFADYSPAMLAEIESERVQVAYRLAAATGVARVYGVDEQPGEGEPDYFPFGEVMAHAAATGQEEAVRRLIASAQERVAAEMAAFRQMPMSEAFIRANNGLLARADFYYALLKLDEGESQPAAELNGYWFMRNAKIFSKLIDVTQPGDRVVIVFGAGHKFWLEHLVENTEGFRKVDPTPYLEAARNP